MHPHVRGARRGREADLHRAAAARVRRRLSQLLRAHLLQPRLLRPSRRRHHRRAGAASPSRQPRRQPSSLVRLEPHRRSLHRWARSRTTGRAATSAACASPATRTTTTSSTSRPPRRPNRRRAADGGPHDHPHSHAALARQALLLSSLHLIDLNVFERRSNQKEVGAASARFFPSSAAAKAADKPRRTPEASQPRPVSGCVSVAVDAWCAVCVRACSSMWNLIDSRIRAPRFRNDFWK